MIIIGRKETFHPDRNVIVVKSRVVLPSVWQALDASGVLLQ